MVAERKALGRAGDRPRQASRAAPAGCAGTGIKGWHCAGARRAGGGHPQREGPQKQRPCARHPPGRSQAWLWWRRYKGALEAMYAQHEARQKERVRAIKSQAGQSSTAERVKQVLFPRHGLPQDLHLCEDLHSWHSSSAKCLCLPEVQYSFILQTLMHHT